MKLKIVSAMIIGILLVSSPVVHGMRLTVVKPVMDYKKQLTTSIEACDAQQFRNTFVKNRSNINQEPTLCAQLEQLVLKIKNEKQAELDAQKPVDVTSITNDEGIAHRHGPFHAPTLHELLVGLSMVGLIFADLTTGTAAVIALIMACVRCGKNTDRHLTLEYTPEMRNKVRLAAVILVPTALGVHYFTDKVVSGGFSKQYRLLKDIDALDKIISCIHSVK